jgi:Dolichyl-phosphate-mannose-protein mannosyltransferase
MNRSAEPVPSSPAPDWRWTALTITLCAVILAPTLAFRMAVDQGVFAYIGAEILEGRWPYLDTWESDYPGLMFLQAAVIFLFGKSIFMFRCFDCLVQLASAYLIYRIAYRVGSHRAAALLGAALFCLVYQGYGTWNTAQREGFGLFFILLGYWLYLTAERRSVLSTALGIGLGIGIAALIKPTLVALSAFYAPLLLQLRSRQAWKPLLTALVGALTPTAALLTFYWIHGGLYQMYEACVLYQSTYTARLRGDGAVWSYWLSKAQRLGGHAIGLAILSAPSLLWGNFRRERFMLYLAYLGSVYAVFVQGTFAGYHYLPGLGVGSILVANVFSQTTAFVFGDRGLHAGPVRIAFQELAALGMLLVATPFYVTPQSASAFLSLRFLERPLPHEYRNGNVFDITETYDVAEYLNTHTQRLEPVQIWGYESLVYYLADRRAASRFQMSHPLVMRTPGRDITPMQQRWRKEFMHAMSLRQPKYIVVVTKDNWWWAPEQKTSEELLDDFPEWKAFIEDNYTLEDTIGRFRIYHDKHSQTRS